MMSSLALATLRARRWSFLGAALALMCTSALLTACGVLLQTGVSGSVATERYAATPLVVQADQSLHFRESDGKRKAKPITEHAWVDASLVNRLRTVPGGDGAVGELTFTASVVLPDGAAVDGPRGGRSLGHAWSSAALTPFTLAAGRAPTADNEVVVDRWLATTAHLRLGASTTLLTSTGYATYRVTGITTQQLADQATLFFSSRQARRLAGHPGQVYAIGLPHATADDAAAIRAALPTTGVQVLGGDGRGTAEFTGAARTRATLVSLAAVLGGTSLMVALLVVSATFALTIAQRSRELALLRAIAATPKQIRRLIGREALLVGVVAATVGSGLGLLVAVWLRSRFVAIGAMPASMALRPGPIPIAVGIVVTTAVGWFAARLSARRTARIHPTRALAETAVEPAGIRWPRLVAGVLALAGFVVLLFVLTLLHIDAASSSVAFAAVMLGATAVALLGPLITRVTTLLLSLPMRSFSPRTGYLAAANNRTNSRRLTAIMTPVTLAVAITCTILFMPASVKHAASGERRAGVEASAVIVANGPGVPGEAANAAREAPGVTAVTQEIDSTVRLGQDEYQAAGMTPGGLGRNLDLGIRTGAIRDFDTGTVMLSSDAAEHRHVEVGDLVTVTLGDGTKTPLRLVATYARGLGFGDAVLPFGLVAAHVDVPLGSSVLVSGTTPAALGTALHRLPAIRVLSAARYRSGLDAGTDISTEIGYLMMGLIIAFTALAIVNTLAMAISARSREFASLRLVGTKRRQVIRMVRVETCAVVTVSIALGTVLGAAVLIAYAAGMAPGSGAYGKPATYAVIVLSALALAWTATALPTRMALRRDPAAAVNERE